LNRDEDLTPDDIRVIEKWVIGDADYYSKIENNLIDWIGECKRLCAILSSYTYNESEQNTIKLFELGAILTDLKYTLSDIIRYADAINRVDRFRSSIGAGTLNQETKKWLAELMGQQLVSDEF
jgi:hypothetical protein